MSFSAQDIKYKPGTSWSGSELTHLRGQECKYPDVLSGDTGYGFLGNNSGEEVDLKIVKNNSGGTLADKKIAKWKSGAVGTEIGGITGDEEIGCGVILAHGRSSGTIPDGEHFFLLIRGRQKVISDGSAITNLSAICTGASGKVKLQDAAVGDLAAHVGISNENPADVDGTVFEAFVDFRY